MSCVSHARHAESSNADGTAFSVAGKRGLYCELFLPVVCLSKRIALFFHSIPYRLHIPLVLCALDRSCRSSMRAAAFCVTAVVAAAAGHRSVADHADFVGLEFGVTEEAAQFNLVMLPNSAASGAVCLDGSPIGFYWQPGVGQDAYNWMIYFQGGGWVRIVALWVVDVPASVTPHASTGMIPASNDALRNSWICPRMQPYW